MAELTQIVGDLLPTDEGSLVVWFGWAEFTVDSDLDWTLVIDGRAESSHLNIVHTLKANLVMPFEVPGPTKVFGGLVFGHELIHISMVMKPRTRI